MLNVLVWYPILSLELIHWSGIPVILWPFGSLFCISGLFDCFLMFNLKGPLLLHLKILFLLESEQNLPLKEICDMVNITGFQYIILIRYHLMSSNNFIILSFVSYLQKYLFSIEIFLIIIFQVFYNYFILFSFISYS